MSFIGEEVPTNDHFVRRYKGDINLKYPLTKEQEMISNKILESYLNHKDTLVYAVCGAGKTELIYKSVFYALTHNLKVGFSVPRKDVVIELEERFKKAFKDYKVVSIYGGNTSNLVGDIICLTTHQLYRFNNYFDLLILDEIDAFPYRDNDTLNALFKRSVKGNYILMSATPSKKLIDEFKDPSKTLLTLFVRFHHNPIPVPKIIYSFKLINIFITIFYLSKFLKLNKKVFIFTPTIHECESLFKIINIFIKEGNFVHSKRDERNKIIEDFKMNKYKFLVTTAVLERGVTVKDLEVIVFNASSEIYSSSALIQIAGRVGRNIDAPTGEVIFLNERITKETKDSIKEIMEQNTHL